MKLAVAYSSDSDALVITKFGADASRSFVANVMAMPGSAGARRAQLLHAHTGAGVERRDAQTTCSQSM